MFVAVTPSRWYLSSPALCPRSALLQSAAASRVFWILALTVSTAESTATLGVRMPITCAKSMAFCTMSRLSSSEGLMLIAASVLSMVPMIVLFFFAQRYFIEGIQLSGLKG